MPDTLHEESQMQRGGHPYPPLALGGVALRPQETYPYPDAPHTFPELQTGPVLMDLTEGLLARTRIINQSNGELPDGWGELDSTAIDALTAGNYSTEQLQDFIHSAFTWQSALANHRHTGGAPTAGNFGSVLSALRSTPVDKLILAYRLDEQGSNELHSMLERSGMTGSVREPLDFYKTIYGCGDTLELASSQSHAQRDPAVRRLLQRESTINELIREMHQELSPADIAQKDPKEKRAVSAVIRNWEDRFLQDIVKLPKDLSDELKQATESRTYDQGNGIADRQKLGAILMQTWSNIKHLGIRENRRLRPDGLDARNTDLLRIGAERAAALRTHAGIVNFDYRSDKQLHLMSRLIEGDPEVIAHLHKGDVTVVFTDELGDHNGSVQAVNQECETPNQRTLTFGITCADDFRAHKELLEKLGIKPSTIVLAGHGQPGDIFFGAGDTQFSLTNELPPALTSPEDLPKNRMYLDYADALLDLIDTGMQDSKGIDDNPEAKGRRRVIITSCYQGAPSDATRYAYRRSPSQHQWEAIPFKTSDNMAEDLIRKLGNNPKLDVVAGDAAQGSTRTRYGIAFWRFQTYKELRNGAPIHPIPVPMKISRYHYDPLASQVRSDDMDELRLRAQPDDKIPAHVPRIIPEIPPYEES